MERRKGYSRICLGIFVLIIIGMGMTACENGSVIEISVEDQLALEAQFYAGEKIVGGGWIPVKQDETEVGKANFGFQLRCTDILLDDELVGCVTGQLEYHDHYTVTDAGYPITFHAKINYVLEDSNGGHHTCIEATESDTLQSAFRIGGTYTPKPKGQFKGVDDSEGFLILQVEDHLSDGGADWFSIELRGGVFDGYTNQGPLAGGNIKAF